MVKKGTKGIVFLKPPNVFIVNKLLTLENIKPDCICLIQNAMFRIALACSVCSATICKAIVGGEDTVVTKFYINIAVQCRSFRVSNKSCKWRYFSFLSID